MANPTPAADPPRDGALMCFGFGYSAAALAARLRPLGWRVAGTTRNAEKAARMRAEGVAAVGLGSAEADAALADADHVLVSAGPTDQGDPTLSDHADALAAAASRLRWIGYLSTTGVYGDHQGGWIDETAPRTPATERGRLRVAAEDAWLRLWREHAAPAHLFRLAGIYGPGRGPFAKLRAGTARRIVKAGQVFSRIHVDDIAAVLAASIARPDPGRAYNVCDNEPAPPQDVIGHAAQLLGMPPPPEVAFETAKAEMSPMAVSFYAESKRVSNRRIREELGVTFQHPDYRSGLAAVLAAEARTNAP